MVENKEIMLQQWELFQTGQSTKGGIQVKPQCWKGASHAKVREDSREQQGKNPEAGKNLVISRRDQGMSDFQEELKQSLQDGKWYEKRLERLDGIITQEIR